MNLTKEIEKERQELREILSRDDSNMGKKTIDLQNLGCRVGASTINLIKGYGQASVPELAQSIHHALQTKSIVEWKGVKSAVDCCLDLRSSVIKQLIQLPDSKCVF